MKTYTIAQSEQDAVESLTVAQADTSDAADLVEQPAPVQPVGVRRLSGGWAGAEWVRYVADYQDAASVGYATLADLERDHQWTTEMACEFAPVERWTAGGAEMEILSVRDEEHGEGEGRACWVMARVNGVKVRLYACPHPDGRPGLEPCGDSLDAWCDDALREYGDDVARDLGAEVIARAG